MGRPQTKQDVILAGNEQINKLFELINSINDLETLLKYLQKNIEIILNLFL